MKANKYKNKYWVLFFALFFLSSCVEEYWPELNEWDEQSLVVDGKISNLPGPYTVKLSLSSKLPDTTFIPETLAKVTILDDQGNQEVLIEKYPGIYQTSLGGIQGIIGHSYKINILLKNGNIYESDYEKLLQPIEIENVLYEQEWEYAQNNLETDQEGYQFYVNSKPAGLSSTYLFWEIEETFEYHADYKIFFYYDGTIASEGISNFFGIKNMYNTDTLFYCWKTQMVAERFSYSLESLSSPIVKKEPLHFISFEDKRIWYGYNILVKQYTISKRVYTFLENLKKQDITQGSIYTSQPFPIEGNINNIHEPNEKVLGYFMVAAGIQAARIQTEPAKINRIEQSSCVPIFSYGVIQTRIEYSTPSDWPLYFTYYINPSDPTSPPIEEFAYMDKECLDCTQRGGVTKKPDFWE